MRGGLNARPDRTPDAFERWLSPRDSAPVAIALSGGGDSLALLHLAKVWADDAGRPLVALTVDHGLQAAGAGWSRFAAERAARLGVAHHTLVWSGDKPRTGLPAAARAARHALLAGAARRLGARVILLGHTADDLLEAEAMRQAGASAPSPRTWSPSPAWPAGRGVFLLRPLLHHRRAELRQMLRGLGESWIDDPANDDPRYSRTLARRNLAVAAGLPPPPVIETLDPSPALAGIAHGAGGDVSLERSAFGEPAAGARRLLGALALCAAGTTRPPSTASLDAALRRLHAAARFTASLAGARIEADAARVTFCREAGERRRGAMAEAELPAGESVFDGRFAIDAAEPGWRIAPLGGLARRLPRAEQIRLRAIAPSARPALPAAISPTGAVTCPVLSDSGPVRAFSLAPARLFAALGGVGDEAALWRVAKTHVAP